MRQSEEASMTATINPNVIDVNEANFEQIVVEGSKQRPVVVDLWASWCEPCKTLGPILEKVADERQGAFLLAKLDVDANQVVASAFGVQSIPTVIAFKDGEPVNGFVGSYPEEAVNEFIDLLVPSEADLEVEEAQVEEAAGDLAGAEADYRDALSKDPKNREAALGLGRILVDRDELDAATELLTPFLPDPDAERVMAAIRVRGWGAAPGEGPLGAARALAGAGRWREAFEGMIAALGSDRDEARATLLDAFASLGDDDPLVVEFRRKLASALF
jgi:putative thioredoxin